MYDHAPEQKTHQLISIPMQKQSFQLFILLAVMLAISGCSRPLPSDINLEQTHDPDGQQIIMPGMGTVGVIDEGQIIVYFQDQNGEWIPDHASTFTIPEHNNGVLALGMGTIGVLQQDSIHFFRLDSDDVWRKEPYISFEVPGDFDRLMAMKMPWDLGSIGVEKDGVIEFYSFYDEKWQHDPTATFRIPSGISGCYPMGDMTMIVADNDKLGMYFLGPENGWEFMDHDAFVLSLPENHTAIIPHERRQVAIRVNDTLQFFQLDLENDRWVVLGSLEFRLPA